MTRMNFEATLSKGRALQRGSIDSRVQVTGDNGRRALENDD